ncbi:hypothetical protein SBBP2_1080011 [Burkholderiales bacterium]|nr:hypothetical protein SBBP2_1080011 [Burkholderiales bacterium]
MAEKLASLSNSEHCSQARCRWHGRRHIPDPEASVRKFPFREHHVSRPRVRLIEDDSEPPAFALRRDRARAQVRPEATVHNAGAQSS